MENLTRAVAAEEIGLEVKTSSASKSPEAHTI